MPRNGSGTYSLPSGNPVVAGTTIEASWANTTLNDVATELTGSLARSGSGGMTGPLRLDAGTAAVPALAWSTETTTGLYRAGANDIRLAVATSDVMRWQATGVSVTGTFGVSGATTLTGAATLSSTLTVTGTTTLTGAATLTANPTLSAGTANGVLYLDGSKVATSGSGLTFDGTILALAGRLQSTVADGAVAARWISATGRVRFRPYVSAALGAFFESTDAAEAAYLPLTLAGSTFRVISDGAQTFSTAGVDRLTLDASGNLGIGTASPAYKLDVRGTIRQLETTAAGYTTQILENSATNGYAQFQFNVGPAGANGLAAISYAPGIFFAIGPVSSDTTTPIVFRNNNGTERARLDASGNLGLGTSTFGTSAAGVLALANGTAPTTGPADTVQIFSVDRSAGNTIPAIRCEGSGVTNAGITNTTVTNKIAISVNGTVYYLLATTNAT